MFPRALFASFLLSCTLACSDKPDTDVDTGSPDDTGEVVADADEDGYTIEQGDCDDTNAAINPEATEICNGVDDNCNDSIDEDAEDATTYFADTDNDGWGDENATETACEQPSGHVTEAGDCNDADADYHPGATEDDCTDPNDYNCDGSVGYEDADGDTHPACEDCDDSLAEINPDADEICDAIDNDCDEEVDEDATDATTWYADSDGDGFGGTQFTETACTASPGFVDNTDDCDDLDASSYPGGTEVCDEADNNCDGSVDEGVGLTWYADVDGDGYGDVSATSEACDSPPGYVANANDCNDTSATISPLALELCDTVDNDCDGDIDENDAIDTSTWYLDSDSDGFGDGSFAVDTCDQPTGYTSDSSDCDDAVATTYPGADELCDSVDNDCDGTTDEDDAVDAGTYYADADADGYGDANNATVSCTQPTGTVSDATDCDDSDNATNPAATEVCDGLDNNCDGTVPTDETDGDGDGYPACEDCNDNYQSIRPGADEFCNGVDDDCDGTVDEDDAFDAGTYYTDADGDGYGDPATATNSCWNPNNLETNADDCDDTDATVNPDGSEICYDGIDSNCSGHSDSDCDEDGYDSDALGGEDCDDSTDAVSPVATETCNSIDDNCDGDVDEDSATDAQAWYADADADGYGDTNRSFVSCNALDAANDSNTSTPAAAITDLTVTSDTVDLTGCGWATSVSVDLDLTHTYQGDLIIDVTSPDGTVVRLWNQEGTNTEDIVGTFDDSGNNLVPTEALSGFSGTDTIGTWTLTVEDAIAVDEGTLNSWTVNVECEAVADATDCDDTDSATYPGATEVCDGADNDCDGVLPTIEQDNDLDGVTICEGDCDDTDGNNTLVLGSTSSCPAESCAAIVDSGAQGLSSGTYYVTFANTSTQAVYCDLTTASGGWTLFGITDSDECAESLPYGPSVLSDLSGSPYLSNAVADESHTEFLQIFQSDGSNTDFTIVYDFGGGSETVSNRIDNSVSSGINVNWTVTDASGTEYALSGNWQYSDNANTSSRWSGSGSNFSDDDGIWGAASGNLNGNSSGPQLQNVSDGWGHENPDSGDSQCSYYYMNGSQNSSSSIRNYMFYR